jgi:RND family efflux transporter MFP subunit
MTRRADITPVANGLVLAFALVVAGCPSEKEPVDVPLLPVKVAAVEPFSGNQGVTYSANIVPYAQVPLLFKSGGFVTTILQRKGADGRVRNVQQGDFVKKDTVLATVRQDDYRNVVEQAKGQLEQAQAAQVKAEQDMKRASALLAANAMTQANFDATKQELDTANGTTVAAHGSLNQAQQSLTDCELSSPMDALVLSRNIEVGMLAAAGTQAFTVADTHLVKAVFGIPDTLLDTVHLGANQLVTTESVHQGFMGRITAITPQADQKSRTFQVEVTIPNVKGALISGMVATLNLGQGKLSSAVLVVPLESIVSAGELAKNFNVYVVTREGDKDVARRRPVRPGNAYGDRVAILSGVDLGDRVITNGATMVKDGQAVRVTP